MLNQLERFSDDVDDLGDEFSYQESMGPKECLAFFEGHVLPVSKDRLILLKLPNMNPISCKAFFKVMMRFVEDKVRKIFGTTPILTDPELEEVAAILTGEDTNANNIEALKTAGITTDIIEDILEANPELAGNT